MSAQSKVAMITGASSGIGAASAMQFAKAGFELILGARRLDKLNDIAKWIQQETGVVPFCQELDVTSVESCNRFVQASTEKHDKIHVLLNNAGLARGLSNVHETETEDDWREMMETNVMGLLRISRLVLPLLIQSGDGHVINIGSIAGREPYAGGAVYCGSKHAVRAITEAIRYEILGHPVRVTTVDPGMVETEFSIVRFHGDEARAKNVYEGMQPLTADDVADCIIFAATRPAHVNIDAIVVKPTAQAGAGKVARN